MKIKRTPLSFQPRAAVWVSDPWEPGDGGMFADSVIERELPTHSPVLGPNGLPLQYEQRQPLGFDLRPKR